MFTPFTIVRHHQYHRQSFGRSAARWLRCSG